MPASLSMPIQGVHLQKEVIVVAVVDSSEVSNARNAHFQIT